MNEQLERVSDAIAEKVIKFCKGRLLVNPVFHANELLAFVRHFDAGVAPDSPSRILRDLRKRGRISYDLLDRRASKYRVKSVA